MALTRLEVYLSLDYQLRPISEITSRIKELKRKVGDNGRISLGKLCLELVYLHQKGLADSDKIYETINGKRCKITRYSISMTLHGGENPRQDRL